MFENFKPKSSGWVMNHFGITRGKLDKYDELISPETRSTQQFNKNKYREYRYEDIEQMWYIHMMSQMGMQMKEIKELRKQNDVSFRDAIIQRIENLEAEKRRIEGMIGIAKMCRETGRIPIPKDFAAVPFSDFREMILKNWNCNKSASSKLLSALSDYQLERQSYIGNTENFLLGIEDAMGKPISDITEKDCLELSSIDWMTIIQVYALQEQLANLYPQEVSADEVMSIVEQYCTYMQRFYEDSEYPLGRIADHMSSLFYDGDSSAVLIQHYGKEKQEYIARAFEYFAENT